MFAIRLFGLISSEHSEHKLFVLSCTLVWTLVVGPGPKRPKTYFYLKYNLKRSVKAFLDARGCGTNNWIAPEIDKKCQSQFFFRLDPLYHCRRCFSRNRNCFQLVYVEIRSFLTNEFVWKQLKCCRIDSNLFKRFHSIWYLWKMQRTNIWILSENRHLQSWPSFLEHS